MKILLIIAIIYYGLKIIGRYTLPFLMKRFMGKMKDRMQQQQGFEEPEDVAIGETTIDKKAREKTSNKNVGEYVDFEDVD